MLMLGSVYLHTVSAVLTDKAAYLDERLAEVRAKGERLDVRVAELSGARRIRSLAIEKLGMKDPRGARLKVYDVDREDGARNGERRKGEVAVTQVGMAPEPALSAAAPEKPHAPAAAGPLVLRHTPRESRRTRLRATGVGSGGSTTGNAAWTTGRRRLWMVVVAFAVIGFLLAGRAVQMIVTDGDRYQAFASGRVRAAPRLPRGRFAAA